MHLFNLVFFNFCYILVYMKLYLNKIVQKKNKECLRHLKKKKTETSFKKKMTMFLHDESENEWPLY
jgi:hypothetical protein